MKGLTIYWPDVLVAFGLGAGILGTVGAIFLGWFR